MRYSLIAIFLLLCSYSFCQTDLQKKSSVRVLTAFNKDSLVTEFNYYKADSVICRSVYDSTLAREVFLYVDMMPMYGENYHEMITYIYKNLVYPSMCDYDIQGKVYVRFIVEPNGMLSNISIVRGVDKFLDDEAMRVIKNMPCWKPGECNGTKVPVFYWVPITFRLAD